MIELVRYALFDDRTLGRLRYGEKTWYTIENPWKDNEVNVSCIPDGFYPMRRYNSPTFGARSWEIAEVPDRTYILIHVANTANDVRGCIGLGMGVYPDLRGVSSSRIAIDEFYEITKDIDEEQIHIRTGHIS